MPFDLAALIPMSLGVSAGWAPNQTAQYKRQDTEDHDLTHHVQRCHETDVAAQVASHSSHSAGPTGHTAQQDRDHGEVCRCEMVKCPAKAEARRDQDENHTHSRQQRPPNLP